MRESMQVTDEKIEHGESLPGVNTENPYKEPVQTIKFNTKSSTEKRYRKSVLKVTAENHTDTPSR